MHTDVNFDAYEHDIDPIGYDYRLEQKACDLSDFLLSSDGPCFPFSPKNLSEAFSEAMGIDDFQKLSEKILNGEAEQACQIIKKISVHYWEKKADQISFDSYLKSLGD